MRCGNCGNETNPENAVHCVRCGTRLAGAAPPGVRPGEQCPRCRGLLPDPRPEVCPSCRYVLSEETRPWDAGRAGVSAMERLSDRAVNLGGGAVGAVLTLLFMTTVSALARRGTFPQRMFNPGGVLNSVPWAITFMFMWSACVLVLRALRLRARRRQMGSPVVGEVWRLLSAGDAGGALRRLPGRSQGSLLLTRIHQVLEQWSLSRNLERAEAAAERQAGLDAEATAGGYSIVRLFVWAMPILGFIGTVIGISLAVGAFSTFLGGNIQDIEPVKRGLMSVTEGLSFAFLTTLHGLLGALFIMLPAAAVQKAEEDFLTDVDRHCAEEIITRLQSASVPAAAGAGGLPQEVIAHLVEALEKHLPSATAWREQMAEFTQASLQRLTEGCVQMAAEMRAAGAGEADRLRDLAERIGAKFMEVGEQLQRDFATTQERVSAESAKAAAEFGKLAASFGEAMQRHQEQFTRTAGELASLSAQAERMAEAQKALSASLDKLASVDSLAEAIAGMREVVESMRPVLMRLTGPLEFRLAPSQPAGGSGS